MVCCAIISLMLAGVIWPIRYVISWLRPSKVPPLMWQLSLEQDATKSMPSHSKFSISARVKSFGYALSGIGFVIRNEHNARIHIFAASTVVALGLAYQIRIADWLVLVLAISGVCFAETMNTAFEYLCDVVSPQKNESVRRAKDIAAGAVLISAFGALVIGVLVFLPYVENVLRAQEVI